MGLIEQLKDRIEQAAKEADRARARATEAESTAQRAEQELAAYKQALAAEERRQGKTPAKATPQQPSLVPGIAREQIDKTGLALSVIAAGGTHGVSADDIQLAFRNRGIDLNRNYIFNIAGRLKTRGKIDRRGGRYYVRQSA
jgi:sRNA-binding protein